MRNYHVVSLGGILDFLEGKRRLPRKSVAITFDDGYLDNYVNAYPYLKKCHLPATIFIATAYVQKRMHLGNLHLPMLSWNEIVEMINNNINIGAHTASHPDLSRIDIQSAKREILESKIEIEKETGKKVDYFAYPYGRYENDVINLVRRLGFRCAFGGEGVIKKNPDMFVLHRVEVKQSIGYAMFKMRLTVALDWYKKLTRLSKGPLKIFRLCPGIVKARAIDRVVVLEALHSVLPVIATPVGRVPDMVEDKVNGVLVKANDPRELATAIFIASRRQRSEKKTCRKHTKSIV
jgi:peptidoglycan/xylan/chitin deacetylase (PgdA/CDA1 family)